MSNRLLEHRKRKDMTQQQVADASGVSQSYYAQLENGTRQLNQRLMASLAKTFGVSPIDLLPGDSEIDRVAALIAALDPEDRQAVLAMAERLARTPPAA